MSTKRFSRSVFLVAAVGIPATASADSDAFIQGVIGYASPIAGQTYMDGLNNSAGAARVGIRAGWTPIVFGNMHLGFDSGVDWRPLTLRDDRYTTQEIRVLAGPRFSFVADHYTVFFRAAFGYDHMYLDGDVDAEGYAIEPGFGASFRHQKLLFGADIAVPITMHSGEDMQLVGADLQLLLSVGAEL